MKKKGNCSEVNSYEKGNLQMNYKEQYDFWLASDYFDEATKAELIAIKEDEKEIEDRFYKALEFGTGGLRGVLGAGTNRMNIYTVRKATQGLADYILQQDKELCSVSKTCVTGQRAVSHSRAERGVVIAYDSRHFSREFAEETALCMAANGIKAYVFDSLRSTPELSFAVRFLGCTAGVTITASHNPPEYNGYKVYWEDGAQITAPRDKEIIARVNAITDWTDVKTVSRKDAEAMGLYQIIGKDMEDAYMAAIKQQILHPEVIRAACKDLKIVYSPFNGTGNVPVCRILKELGFEQVYVVEEQQMPDPDFTTLGYPNPESPASFTLALNLAKEVSADIVLATDPDADRLGIYVKSDNAKPDNTKPDNTKPDNTGPDNIKPDNTKPENDKALDYIPFTGNMSGGLICEYILRERTALGKMPSDPALVSTIVTTDMVKKMAERYGVHFVEVLTGFKYIGAQITRFEEEGKYHFIFGLEESYGCLAGTHCRDKDGIVAVMCLCEVAAWCKSQGRSLWEMMLELYETYGYYKEDQYTVTLKGIEGSRRITEIMNKLRKEPPKQIGEFVVQSVRDYKTGEISSKRDSDSIVMNGLPKSNVLYFELSGDAWCCVRPSGTEPKIKCYMGVKGTSLKDADAQLTRLKEAVKILL